MGMDLHHEVGRLVPVVAALLDAEMPVDGFESFDAKHVAECILSLVDMLYVGERGGREKLDELAHELVDVRAAKTALEQRVRAISNASGHSERVAALKARIQELREYARHPDDCGVHEDEPCTCGLEALRARLED